MAKKKVEIEESKDKSIGFEFIIECKHENKVHINDDLFYCKDCNIWHGNLFEYLFGDIKNIKND